MNPGSGTSGVVVVEGTAADGSTVQVHVTVNNNVNVNTGGSTGGNNGGGTVVTPPTTGSEHEYSIYTNQLVRIDFNTTNYTVTQGSNLVTVKLENGKIVVRPVDGANGTAVIVVTDSNGGKHKYTFHITPYNAPKVSQQVTVGSTVNVNIDSQHTLTVESGGGNVSISNTGGGYIITAKNPGTTVLVERNPWGVVVKRYEIIITQVNTPAPKPTPTPNPNPNPNPTPNPSNGSGKVEIKDNGNGSWTVTNPGGGKIDVEFTTGGDLVDVIKNPDGSLTIRYKEGKQGNVTFYVLINGVREGGDKKITNNFNQVINNNGSSVNSEQSSRSECIGPIIGLLAPLLFLIPVAILSQVRIPGWSSSARAFAASTTICSAASASTISGRLRQRATSLLVSTAARLASDSAPSRLSPTCWA